MPEPVATSAYQSSARVAGPISPATASHPSGTVTSLDPPGEPKTARGPDRLRRRRSAASHVEVIAAEKQSLKSNGRKDKLKTWCKETLKHRWFSWIEPRLQWRFMIPVIRSALAAWLGLLLLLFRPVESAVGQAAFLGLIVAGLMPPYQPVVQSLESLGHLYFWNALAWAWVNLGVFVSWQVRGPVDAAKVAAAEAKWAYLQAISPTDYQLHILHDGTYLQAAPTVLWYKICTAPAPSTLAIVISQVLIDIGLTTAVIYPTPLYTAGQLFFLPMAIQGGICALCALFFFPESVSHSFMAKFGGVLGPMSSAMKSFEDLCDEASKQAIGEGDERDDDVEANELMHDFAQKGGVIRARLVASLAGITPLRAQQRYLSIDFSFGRLSGHDLKELLDIVIMLQQRSSGLAFFFDVVNQNVRHSHLDSSAFRVEQDVHSQPPSQGVSPSASGRATPRHEDPGQSEEDGAGESHTPTSERHEAHDVGYFRSRLHLPDFRHRHSVGVSGHRDSHTSLLDHIRKTQQPVGVYESHRYMDLEKSYGRDVTDMLKQVRLLAVAALPLVRACSVASQQASQWLVATNKERQFLSRRRHRLATAEKVEMTRLQSAAAELQNALDEFRTTRRNAVGPYKHLFDPAYPAPPGEARKSNFRGIFSSFVAQYHLIEFTIVLLRLLQKMEEFDQSRSRPRLFYPHPDRLIMHFWRSNKDKDLVDDNEQIDATFTGVEESEELLGEARRRDPEHVPYDNAYLFVLSRLARMPEVLKSRSFMYAVKAGVLTALVTLPEYLPASASFYYYNRGVWATFMAQLTLGIYAGDTAFAWVKRVVASFWGCLLGMLTWYIGCGSGAGNPYGLAAVCAVVFPFTFFFRIYYSGPVLVVMLVPITWVLVVGYSWYNGSVGALTDATWGWSVAWRRFVCAVIGVTAAWIFSCLPPTYSGKRAIRHTYAQTIQASGVLLCQVLSRANDQQYRLHESEEMRTRILTWRTKLAKLGVRHMNAQYELSLQGRWPEERYQAIRTALEDLLALLSQLNHVINQLHRPWRKALLMRTRLADPEFLGAVLGVITICSSALDSGTALPQITPSPLLARMRLGKIKGLDLPPEKSDISGEVPTFVTVEVLESDDYMRYALGVTTIASLLARLDRLVLICKTLLGENYHISGIHFDHLQV